MPAKRPKQTIFHYRDFCSCRHISAFISYSSAFVSSCCCSCDGGSDCSGYCQSATTSITSKTSTTGTASFCTLVWPSGYHIKHQTQPAQSLGLKLRYLPLCMLRHGLCTCGSELESRPWALAFRPCLKPQFMEGHYRVCIGVYTKQSHKLR